MDFLSRRWSCYPTGIASRRDFLHTVTMGAAGLALSTKTLGGSSLRSQAESSQTLPPLPAFPPNGFGEGAIHLNFNENPLGPSPRALKALREDGMTGGNHYNFIDPLIERLATHLDFPTEQILIGCGSTEFLQFAPWSLFRDGGSLVLPTPTYGWCAGVVSSMGGEVRAVPVTKDGNVDLDAIHNACDQTTRLVYLSNPNNPTGASVTLSELRRLSDKLPRDSTLFVDEAYAEFLPDGSATALIEEGGRVLVARTFSKAYGLAGIRLGYLVGRRADIDILRGGWWGDLGINRAANIAGPAALSDQQHVSKYVETMNQGLDYLKKELSTLGFESLPHRAPFFMTRWDRPTRPLAWKLMRQKIYVRDGSDWEMPNYLRISVGTPDENRVFVAALKALI